METAPPAPICPSAADSPPLRRERIASVDTLRGLIIALMIFVNDAAGVRGAPSWLRHVSARADGMTLPDIVFPAFLFIAGMSIPLALGHPDNPLVSRSARFLRILGRTLTLLVMGVLMVNMETHSPWRHQLWDLLTYACIFLAFAGVGTRGSSRPSGSPLNVAPESPSPWRAFFRGARWLGAAGLLALALAYTDEKGRHLLFGPWFDPADTVWLRSQWWGILGLIGWAYLVAASLYLLVGRRREWLLGAAAFLMLLFVGSQADYPARLAQRPWLDWAEPALNSLTAVFGWVNSHVAIGEVLGALASVTAAGVCLGSILLPQSGVSTPAQRLRWAGVFCGGLVAAAVVLDANWGLNKIQATPAWCWLCAALTGGIWMALYWLMDVKGVTRWSAVLRPAGANPLLAYVLHPFVYLVTGYLFAHLNPLLGTNLRLDFYRDRDWPVAASLLGCLLMSLGIIQLTGLIAKAGYRLKA